MRQGSNVLPHNAPAMAESTLEKQHSFTVEGKDYTLGSVRIYGTLENTRESWR